jgi:hypothetical protein
MLRIKELVLKAVSKKQKRQQGAGARSADAIVSKGYYTPEVKICQEKNAA